MQKGAGGYFGPSGAAAITIQRNPSNVVREPNLTPITERSEYSNRNSIMSLPQSAGSYNNISGLGLAQLAGMMRDDDGAADLSYNSLAKARNKAFGGSSSSIPLAGQGTPSPTIGGGGLGFDGASSPAERERGPGFRHLPWQPQSSSVQLAVSSMGSAHNSTASAPAILPAAQSLKGPSKEAKHLGSDGKFIGESPECKNDMHSSPDIHAYSHHINYMESPTKQSPAGHGHGIDAVIGSTIPKPPAALRNSLELRPVSPNAGDIQGAVHAVSPSAAYFDAQEVMRQRRRSVGAEAVRRHKASGSQESISYTKEEDPINGEKWILTRTRTNDGAEDEVSREEVKGGRI